MKKSGIIISLLLGLGLLTISSCGKSKNSNASVPQKTENTVQIPQVESKADTTANHNVKAINLRQIENFAIFANTSISSTPSSSITGKVGLRPGIRALITLDPTEVVGGLPEIYAGDDKDLDTAAFVKQAKLDLISAYNSAETSTADADKIGLWNGNLGNKILAPGIYQWKSQVTIPMDLKLEGSATDVWIFKMTGQLRVGTNVHVTLSGGALAQNVFWQVGSDVLLKAGSSMVGTIISQQTFEMKEQASLLGRALVKNDKLILNKNTITKP